VGVESWRELKSGVEVSRDFFLRRAGPRYCSSMRDLSGFLVVPNPVLKNVRFFLRKWLGPLFSVAQDAVRHPNRFFARPRFDAIAIAEPPLRSREKRPKPLYASDNQAILDRLQRFFG
jgi:hypothetical protein